MKDLQDVMNTLPAERRAKIKARAEELIAEEMTLRDLRKAGMDEKAKQVLFGQTART